jgi:carbon-monoxide dehydrogenase medium subunit
MLAMRNFEYFRAESLEETIFLIQKNGQTKILAGGTDLIPKMKRYEINPKTLIDIKRIPDLRKFKCNGDGSLSIGPLVTFSDILDDSVIKGSYPILYQSAQVLGTAQTRNRATIGGNICNGSPAGDSIPPLICLDAQLRLINQEGERWISVEHFFESPQKTCLRSDELLSEIKIPPFRPKTFGAYMKLGARKALEIAIISVGVLITFSKELEIVDDIRISLGSVAPIPIRCRQAEDILKGKEITEDIIKKTSLEVQKNINPISDLRGTSEYRHEMAYILTKRALEGLITKQ